MNLFGLYSGSVEDNADPRQLGRLRVRVPHVYGPGLPTASVANANVIGTEDLPWAMPSGLPAGQDSWSGGMMWIPRVGDRVWVRFLDGEPEKPVWEWGMQDIESNEKYFEYLRYKEDKASTPLEKTLLTRYHHTMELNPFGIIHRTAHGYGLLLTDSTGASAPDGSIFIMTQLGSFFSMDDSTLSTQMMGQYYTSYFLSDSTSFAKTFVFESSPLAGLNSNPSLDGITTPEVASIVPFPFGLQVKSEKIILGSTLGRTVSVPSLTPGGPPTLAQPEIGLLDPMVRLSDLQDFTDKLSVWLDSIFEWIQLHIHPNGNQGSPTGPNMTPPPIPTDVLSYLTTLQCPTGSPIVFSVKTKPQ